MTPPTTTGHCPSDFALDDRVIHGAAQAAIDAHVATCERCQGRLGQRAARVAHFDDVLAEPVWQAVRAQRGSTATIPGRRRRSFVWPVVAVALGVAALLLLVRGDPRAPSTKVYLAAKGGAAVQIICRRGGRVFTLVPDEPVSPGDELRFVPLPVSGTAPFQAAFIQIGSIDGSGGYVPFYPSAAGGASVPLPERGAALAGSIRLDEARGPERLFVVLSAQALPVAAVAATALANVDARTRAVQIGGAPVFTDWVVLDKRPASNEGR